MFGLRVLIAFLIIFNFPIPGIYNSAILAFFLISLTYLFNTQHLCTLLTLSRNKNIIIIFFSLFSVIFISVIPGVLHLTFDFGILKAFLLQAFLLGIGFYALPILYHKDANQFQYILQLLLSVFLLQSIVEILALTFPPISDFVHFFQKESVAKKDMGGIRALALTGNPFFDLAAGFGMIYILYFKWLIDKYAGTFNFKRICLFAILFVGTFFAGRTGFVGLLMGLGFYFFNFKKLNKRLSYFLKLVLALTALGFLIYIVLPPNIKDVLDNQLLPFAFEFIYNYIDTGQVTTDSTEVLNNMYFPLSLSTFVFGDGRYFNPDGSYYMHTDAGYMRFVLYYGVFGVVVLLGYQLQFFRHPVKIIVNLIRGNSTHLKKAKSDLLFFITLFVYVLVLHYKGEVLGFLPIIQIMLFWVGFAYKENRIIVFDNKSNKQKRNE